ASAIRWADECQKAAFPPRSFHVRIFMLASAVIGRDRSHTSPSTSMARAFRASPSLMLRATSAPVTPWLNSRLLPSGNVSVIVIALGFANSVAGANMHFEAGNEKL